MQELISEFFLVKNKEKHKFVNILEISTIASNMCKHITLDSYCQQASELNKTPQAEIFSKESFNCSTIT